MTDPYQVMGLAADCDDETIRRRYLELVKQFSPEQHPEKFAAVRAAYESLPQPGHPAALPVVRGRQARECGSYHRGTNMSEYPARVSLKTLLATVLKP